MEESILPQFQVIGFEIYRDTLKHRKQIPTNIANDYAASITSDKDMRFKFGAICSFIFRHSCIVRFHMEIITIKSMQSK